MGSESLIAIEIARGVASEASQRILEAAEDDRGEGTVIRLQLRPWTDVEPIASEEDGQAMPNGPVPRVGDGGSAKTKND